MLIELRNKLSHNAQLNFCALDRMIELIELELKKKESFSPYKVKMLEADCRRLRFIRKEIKDLEIFDGYAIEKGVINE